MSEPDHLTPAQERAENWRYRIEQVRYNKPFTPPRLKTPASVPPAARRLMALLYWVGLGDGRSRLATKDCPPLTPDMKKLIARDYCRLERNFPMHYSQEQAADLRRTSVQRVTSICITEAGRRALAKAHVSDADYQYIRSALYTGSLL